MPALFFGGAIRVTRRYGALSSFDFFAQCLKLAHLAFQAFGYSRDIIEFFVCG